MALLVVCVTAAFAEGAAIGHVIRVTPGAFAVRDGQTVPLALKDAVYANDVINTDASGRVQIIFTDDSTVSIANASSFHMREYVEGDAGARFNGHLANGLVRVVTGFIVEQNPEAFQLSTPLGSAGIRGTIVSLRHQEQHSTIWVENTPKIVVFNGVSLHEGLRMDITPDGHRVSSITSQDLDTVEQETQISKAPTSTEGGSRVYVGQQDAYTAIYQETDTTAYSLQSDGKPQTVAVIDWDYLLEHQLALAGASASNPLPSVSAYTNTLRDEIIATGLSGSSTALVTGSLASVPITNFAGLFSFKADLSTGAVSGGSMQGRWRDGNSNYSLTGGTGTASPTGAAVSWNEVVITSGALRIEFGTSELNLTGNYTLDGSALSGNYIVRGDAAAVIDQGTASGNTTIVTVP